MPTVTMYHVTPTVNVPDILARGFVPKTERPDGYPPRTYFARTLEDATRVLVFKIAERGGVDHQLLVLRVKFDGVRVFRDPDPKVSASVYVTDPLPRDRLEVLANLDASTRSFPLGHLQMHYRDLARFLERRIAHTLRGATS